MVTTAKGWSGDDSATLWLGFDNRPAHETPGSFNNESDRRYLGRIRKVMSHKAVVAVNSESGANKVSLVALIVGTGEVFTLAVHDNRTTWVSPTQFEISQMTSLFASGK